MSFKLGGTRCGGPAEAESFVTEGKKEMEDVGDEVKRFSVNEMEFTPQRVQ